MSILAAKNKVKKSVKIYNIIREPASKARLAQNGDNEKKNVKQKSTKNEKRKRKRKLKNEKKT